MASTTLKVARWFALGFGISYGYVHRRSLEKNEEIQKAWAVYKHKEELIQKAKAAYAAKQTSPSPLGVISNPEDPNFDLDKYVAAYEAKQGH